VAVYAEQVNTNQQAAVTAVRSVVASEGGEVQAARFAAARSGASVASALARAAALAPRVAQVAVQPAVADAGRNVLPEGFSYSAPTQLVLFVFINALAAGAAIIETRRLGMFERMSAAPVRAGTIIAGTALTYASLTLVQSALIVLVGAVAFGVAWGNPLAAGALVVTWALVGTGAGMLSGTVFRTAEQATAVGAVSGIGLGMLGGCMWPLSIVSSTMRVVGHLTPQAWAVDAWTGLVARGGNLASIAGQLAILAAFAVGFVVLASVRLRRELL
jgi:ABC-2 type transport system permease protein